MLPLASPKRIYTNPIMRYSDKQKADVVAFVKKHNQEKGRGGQSAAKEKFKISPISIANWLTAAGEDLPGKGGRKKSSSKAKNGKAGRPKGSGKGKAGRPKGSGKAKAKPGPKPGPKKSSSATGSLSEKLQRLSEIDSELQGLQAEFDKLKASL